MSKNKKTHLVSVIIPVYKVEFYLHECVDSVLSQTYKNIEVILVDDGSPDNCPAICDEYASKDNRVRVIHKENGGLSDARNAGIHSATGEYLVFIDSDDKLANKTCLQELVSVFVDDVSVYYLNNTITENTNETKYIKKDSILLSRNLFFRKIIDSNYKYPTAWSFICKTDFIKENALYFEKGLLHEDELWMPQVLLCAREQQICVFNNYFYFYRTRRSGSISFYLTEKNITAKLYIANKLQKMSAKSREEQKFLNTRAAQLLASTFIWGRNVLKSNTSLKKEIKQIRHIFLKSNKPKHWILYFLSGVMV